MSAIRGELSSTAALMEQTYAVLKVGGPPEYVAGKLNELTAKQSELSNNLASKEAEQQAFSGRNSRFYASREEIKTLVKALQMPASDELYKLRAQIASRLKVLVETLLIASRGAQPSMQRSIDQLKEIGGEGVDDVIAHMQQLAAEPDQSRRYFAVGFRDAAVRAVFPTYGDPLRFEQQIVAGENPIEGADQTSGKQRSIDVLHPPDQRTRIV